MEAIEKDWTLIKYVKNQTYEICYFAVNVCWEALEFVKPEFKTPEICTLALLQSSDATKFIK